MQLFDFSRTFSALIFELPLAAAAPAASLVVASLSSTTMIEEQAQRILDLR